MRGVCVCVCMCRCVCVCVYVCARARSCAHMLACMRTCICNVLIKNIFLSSWSYLWNNLLSLSPPPPNPTPIHIYVTILHQSIKHVYFIPSKIHLCLMFLSFSFIHTFLSSLCSGKTAQFQLHLVIWNTFIHLLSTIVNNITNTTQEQETYITWGWGGER